MGQVIRNSVVQADAVPIPGGKVDALPTDLSPASSVAATSAASSLHFGVLAAATVSQVVSPPHVTVDAEQHRERLNAERDQAAERGYEDGFDRGLEAAKREYDVRLQTLAGLIERCEAEIELRLQRLDDEWLELVFVAVTRVLGDALSSRAGVEAIVRQVIEQQRDEDLPLTVRVCARDWELLGDEGRAVLTRGRPMLWRVDEKIEMGGCIVDGGRGTLDGRLETQLAKVKQVLLDCHASRHAP